MEAHTVTVINKQTQLIQTMNWPELQTADFNFNKPFQIVFPDVEPFFAEQVVRIIPARRMVVFGTWQGKAVVAKLFYSRHARQHVEKELKGVKTLQDRKVPTPALLYHGELQDKRVQVMLFERIKDAENLHDVWVNKKHVDEIYYLLQAMVIELATQHVLGVMQQDMHLKNFLVTEKIVYTLDGGQVALFPYILSKKQSMENLALFLSQLGVGVETYQEKLFRHYAKARGWRVKDEDLMELFFLIKNWNEQRWQRYQKKIFRECSDFACINDWRRFGIYDRKCAGPEWQAFIKNPESVFQGKAVSMLKAGRSSTVIKVVLDNRELVVKRYNLKNIWHRLRRSLRHTRASNSWRLAQKLKLFGVATAKPVAFIENKFLGFRGTSYYVTEYVSGEHAGAFLRMNSAYPKAVSAVVERVAALIKNLMKLDITHGDLKITNILLDEHQRPVFIDLDGAVEHISLSSSRSAWRKEIKRFLQNFDDQPALQDEFRKVLV